MTHSWWHQYKALLYRNLLFKRRNMKQFSQELFLPIYFICLLAVIKALVPLPEFVEAPISPAYGLFNNSFVRPSNSTIHASPNTTRVGQIMATVSTFLDVQYKIYTTADEALTGYKSSKTSGDLGVIFYYNENRSDTSFAIRAPYNDIASTSIKKMFIQPTKCREKVEDQDIQLPSPKQCMTTSYLFTGFSALHAAISTAMIRLDTNASDLSLPNISVSRLPKAHFTTDPSYILIITSIYFVIAFSPLISILSVNLVAEKEKKIKEGMRMMGMKDSAFWCAWTTVYALVTLFITLVIVLIAFIATFFSRDSNLFIFFLMIFLYGMSIINMSFMISPFFHKATTAGAFASFASIIISLLYLSVSLTRTYTPDGFTYDIPPWGRWLMSLLSPVAFSLALDQGLFLDLRKGGMTFSRMTYGEFPLYAPIVMLLIDVILYGFLSIYFENVIPGEYGQRRSPLYFLKRSFWCKTQPSSVNASPDVCIQDDNIHLDIEPIADEFVGREGVQIDNIRKVFKKDGEHIAAVDGLSLTMYEGQITALLGHNGAGKTTLINMMIGLTPVTSGKAWINRLSVTDRDSMDEIRTKTGVCPQQNILLDDLTCREHLVIFSGFKGIPPAERETAVSEALESVDLTDKADTIAKNLSGGQKRKLSVAIALIGDPKILFLDEPTAGMDPYSRRHLWSLLQSKKEGRIILLTTHFMDEADILADRKAIISKGKLRCCGSSLFLKTRFGIGYHLNMVTEPTCDIEAVTKFLQKYATEMQFVRSHGSELSYTLPFQSVSAFASLFTDLESNGQSRSRAETLGITSYGVSMTTLEEVFLKLAEDESVLKSADKAQAGPDSLEHGRHDLDPSAHSNVDINPTIPHTVMLSDMELLRQRFYANIRLRFIITINHFTSFFFFLFLPVIFIIIGIVLNKLTAVKHDAQQPVGLNLHVPLAAYTKMKVSNFSTGPPMLFQDSTTGPGIYISHFYQALKSIFDVKDIYNETDLLNIGHHFLGPNISYLQPVGSHDFSLSFTALYNYSAVHAIPVLINQMMNSLAGLIKRAPPDVIEVHSLPWNSSVITDDDFNSNVFSSVILIGMAFIVIAPGFALFVIRDKECKARSLLRVSGVTVNMYWTSLFVYSCLLYMIPLILTIVVILGAQLETFATANAMGTLIIVLLLYMATSILFSFNLSFLFKTFETSAGILPNIFIFASLIPYLAVSLVDMISSSSVASYLHLAFCIVDPPYIFLGSLYYIDKIYRIAKLNTLTLTFSDYFISTHGINILISVLCMLGHIVWLGYLLRVLDVLYTGGNVSDTCRRQSTITSTTSITSQSCNHDIIADEDADVADERVKVDQWFDSASDEAVVMVRELRKEYKAKQQSKSCSCGKGEEESEVNVAVRNATFGVAKGEVFGLLGPNGAGKTTILNMIMADIGPDCGFINVAGHNIQSSLSEAFQALGVCPQHDALWDLVTLRQHLTTYALIEGVPRGQVKEKIDYFIDAMYLREHADKKAKKLSGGTKRKLSFAISMMGVPKIVLMDEPSTGMDPQSKRFFWDTISSSFNGQDRGAILTTHYMEEADALCSRVAIMVNGEIKCIGSTQHLKDKYGSGYILEMKVDPGVDATQRLTSLDQFVKSVFIDAVCSEQFGDRVTYKIPQNNVASLGKSFESLERAKIEYHVMEYSFSQSSLEQVFLEFAKAQLDEGEKMEKVQRKSPKH